MKMGWRSLAFYCVFFYVYSLTQQLPCCHLMWREVNFLIYKILHGEKYKILKAKRSSNKRNTGLQGGRARPRGGSKKRGLTFKNVSSTSFCISPVETNLILQKNANNSLELGVGIIGDVFIYFRGNSQVFAFIYLIQILRWDTWKCFSFAVVVALKCFSSYRIC